MPDRIRCEMVTEEVGLRCCNPDLAVGVEDRPCERGPAARETHDEDVAVIGQGPRSIPVPSTVADQDRRLRLESIRASESTWLAAAPL